MTITFSAPALYRTPIVDPATGLTTWVWTQAFQALAQQLLSPVSTSAPASSAATGTAGQIATDSNFLYVCIGTNSWKRIALSAF